MKLTVDIEQEFVEIAKCEIYGFYDEALHKAQERAERDVDRIATKIVLLVKSLLKEQGLLETQKFTKKNLTPTDKGRE
jgi:hypothetical protein